MKVLHRIKAKDNHTVELYQFGSQVYARLVDSFGFTIKDNINEAVNKIDTFQEALKFAYKYQL